MFSILRRFSNYHLCNSIWRSQSNTGVITELYKVFIICIICKFHYNEGTKKKILLSLSNSYIENKLHSRQMYSFLIKLHDMFTLYTLIKLLYMLRLIENCFNRLKKMCKGSEINTASKCEKLYALNSIGCCCNISLHFEFYNYCKL